MIGSKWHGDDKMMRKNASVRPMFDMLCDLHFGNTHEYVYEMAATTPALKDAIGRMAWDSDVSMLYIAAHGSQEGLHLHGGEHVSRAKLCNMLWEEGGRRRNLNGLYLGSCEFGTENLAEFLLERDQQLRWVAGYRHTADFIDGTALDVVFFNSWLKHIRDDPKARPRELIEIVASEMRVNCRGLINTPEENGHNPDDEDAPGMGFSVYVRTRGPKSKIIDLMRDNA